MSNDPHPDLAVRAERDSAMVSAALHTFAAAAVPALLWDAEVVRRANLIVFTSVELLLAVLALLAFVAGRNDHRLLFHRLTRVESIGAALNFGALAWLGPNVASSSPSKYLLTVTLVALTAIAASNSSLLIRRRSSFLSTLAIIGTSHFVAYAVKGEVIFASFTAVWCVALAYFSRIGYDAMRQLSELQRQSALSARHDDLTGLLNRSAFIEALESRKRAAAGSDVLVLLDLDGFKAINDGYGHASGDAVLRAVAGRLERTLPAGTDLGRLGGDEFAALVPLGAIDLRVTLERVLDEVGLAVQVDDRDLYVAGSIGWTHLKSGIDAPELMAEADAAMYQSKASSTVNSTGFNSQMRADLERSLELRQRFRSAVKERRIEFLAQPVVRASDQTPIGIELLARWPGDDHADISPEEFTLLADETGLAVELDRLALTEARRLLEEWRHDPYLESIVVKVNVSPIHLQNLALARSIRDLIPDGDRDRLGLEFVETKLMASNARTHALLRELKTMGVTISIDDFGTGYSSLAYLRTLPVSEIKIDRSFVTGLDTDQVNAGLVKAIVDLASTLGMTTIAEGVESHEELLALQHLGIGAIQGFLTGKPIPLDEVGKSLRARREATRQVAQIRDAQAKDPDIKGAESAG
jgi:diguanylate cyclase (GGDEF)-like protein